MNKTRRAGVLMPISALPAKYGIGTLGKCAYNFIKWLKSAKIRVWQTLPLLPTNYGDSPYQACDSHALNPYFIDFELLKEQGLLKPSDYNKIDFGSDENRVDYEKMFHNKAKVLRVAFSRFDKTNSDWQVFLSAGEYKDYGVFMALKCANGYKPFTDWGEYSKYNQMLIDQFVLQNQTEVEFWQFTQFLFLKQWSDLKDFANQNGVEIMGDMPIYVAFDSVENWKYGSELFLLDANGNPALVAGVPPDAFSDDGQLWGNPLYNWEKMKQTGYKWWKNRINHALSLFDILRIDHFRGFDRFFAIPADAQTAKAGEWMQGPSSELFKDIKHLSIVAEDLGVIDDGVISMMRQTGYPGMKVMQFGLDGNPWNEHTPSNYVEHCVVYTGTHDNQPFRGYIDSLEEYKKQTFDNDLLKECGKLGVVCDLKDSTTKCKTVVKLLLASNAFLAIIPMQDILCLGDYSRMNTPSTLSPDNWSYRFKKEDFSKDNAIWLSTFVSKYDR
ncbi:MAG: 4-alpha-glucanotransferase [Clostridia bacterium]|nr:4-alpha-glucanotransferase [Clostridia bacterium]